MLSSWGHALRIRELRVSGYRSLKNISMSGLGDLVILIGKNGSGKSNILEALELFFADLNLQTDYGKAFPPTTWYDKRTTKPIDFIVTIELESGDLEGIIPKDLLPSLPLAAKEIMLVIHRQLEINAWKNVKTTIGDALTIEGGKVMSSTSGKESPVTLPPEKANMLLTNLNNHLKNSFRLIRSPREAAERPAPLTRPSILDAESKSALTQLAVHPDREKEIEWGDLKDDYRRITGKDLQVRANALEFQVGNLVLPTEFSGSGDQALMILMRHFLDPKPFHGIEEPETRLHNAYTRKLHYHLKFLSGLTQIFVATHSSVFVDRALLRDTWYVSMERNETRVKRIENEGLKNLLIDLGIRPSDVFLANRILLVEGATEKNILPMVADKAGVNLGDVNIIPIYGKSKGKYSLTVWSDAVANTGLPVYMLLDKNGSADAVDLLKKKLIDRESYQILSKKNLAESPDCDIEDYYNKEILKKVVEDWKMEHVASTKGEELTLEPDKPVVKKINAFLGTQDWKVPVGIAVVDKMTSEQIHEEMDDIVRFLRKVAGK
jgi:hypothetical protein